MKYVQVRDVPDDVHAELVRRAARAGQSLQQYLLAELAEIARTPTIDDVIDRIERNLSGVSLSESEVIGALEGERARR